MLFNFKVIKRILIAFVCLGLPYAIFLTWIEPSYSNIEKLIFTFIYLVAFPSISFGIYKGLKFLLGGEPKR